MSLSPLLSSGMHARATCYIVSGVVAGAAMEEALRLAQTAGYQQAVARVHYLAGNFLQALHCTIATTSTPGNPSTHHLTTVYNQPYPLVTRPLTTSPWCTATLPLSNPSTHHLTMVFHGVATLPPDTPPTHRLVCLCRHWCGGPIP